LGSGDLLACVVSAETIKVARFLSARARFLKERHSKVTPKRNGCLADTWLGVASVLEKSHAG
jgi:hypothetical protein